MANASEFLVHHDPVWREQANFIIHAPLPPSDYPAKYEQLWVRKSSADIYEICCVPLYVYGLDLGDIVSTRSNEALPFIVHRVIRHSGRPTFRVWFGTQGKQHLGVIERVQNTLLQLEALIERGSKNLIGISAQNAEHGARIFDALCAFEAEGILLFERGSAGKGTSTI